MSQTPICDLTHPAVQAAINAAVNAAVTAALARQTALSREQSFLSAPPPANAYHRAITADL